MDGEVKEFLYGDGTNPFSQAGFGPDQPSYGRGIEQDPFEPAHDRPNVHYITLMRMGIVKKDAGLLGEQESGTTGGSS